MLHRALALALQVIRMLHALAASQLYMSPWPAMERTSVLWSREESIMLRWSAPLLPALQLPALLLPGLGWLRGGRASAGTATTRDSRVVAALQLAGGCRLLLLRAGQKDTSDFLKVIDAQHDDQAHSGGIFNAVLEALTACLPYMRSQLGMTRTSVCRPIRPGQLHVSAGLLPAPGWRCCRGAFLGAGTAAAGLPVAVRIVASQ